jgi:hypothetical protein
MLYRQEKLCFALNKTSHRIEPTLATTKYCMFHNFSLRWFASTIQMYSRLCPWLLTWSDYEEDYEEGDDEYDDVGAN